MQAQCYSLAKTLRKSFEEQKQVLVTLTNQVEYIVSQYKLPGIRDRKALSEHDFFDSIRKSSLSA